MLSQEHHGSALVKGRAGRSRAATTSMESTSGSTTRRFFCGGLATSLAWLQGATCATELPPAPRTNRSAASLFSRAGPEQRADDAQIVATSTCKRAPAQSSSAAQSTAAAACAAWKPSGTLSQYVAASQAATDRSGPRAAAQAARAWRSARFACPASPRRPRARARRPRTRPTRSQRLAWRRLLLPPCSFLLFGFDGEDALPVDHDGSR